MWQPPRESDYTRPTEICPHPEWWTTENALSTECEVSRLVAALVQACQPEFIVEVGTHYGQTAERIARVMAENGHGEFVSLEIDLGMFQSATNRCSVLPADVRSRLELVHINSREYIPTKPIDFLFVDGAGDRITDVRYFAPYLSARAIVIVHDTGYSPYDHQVGGMLDILGGQHIQLDTPRGVLIVKLAG